MKILLVLLLLIPSLQEDLRLLNAELARTTEYDARHESYIDSLRSAVQEGDSTFGTYFLLFEAYSSYHFDSAYHYVQCLERVANDGDRDHFVLAKVKKSFALFSAGMFKESYDILNQLEMDSCSRDVQALYYATFARLCLDLGVYSDGVFYDSYTHQGIEYLSRQLEFLTPRDTFTYNYSCALRAAKQDKWQESVDYFTRALRASTCTDHERAIAFSTMSYPAKQLGDTDAALHYNIMAAIYDVRGSVNEAVALRFVASDLHELGYCDEAMRYIDLAKSDAEYYGARHRQMEINQILPIIEHEQVRLERRLHVGTIAVLLFVIFVLIVLSFLLVYLRRKLRALGKAHEQIEQMNGQLIELGKIKEEYIGNYLLWQSDMVRNVDSIHTHLLRLTRERDINAMVAYIQSLPRSNRRQQFMYQFDHMFLTIHPNYVEEFNARLCPEYRIEPKEGELLTPEMRIFALIQLGITSNEKIAQVLDYSVNTVYAYKTKIKSHQL